ncbi:MAG: transcription elongation factor GreA [bacterium]
MDTSKHYLTKEKLEELKTELDFLKKKKRKEIAEDLEYARALGDLSENAEYHAAREMQASVEDRIMKIEEILKNAEIVTFHHSEVIQIGSTVTVQKATDKLERTYTIVGSEEANTAQAKISNISPLGKELMGKKKGDTFKLTTPAGVVDYKIISIA